MFYNVNNDGNFVFKALPRQFRPTANNSGKACLQDVVDWMLSESGSDAKVYREECIRLVEVLCPIVRGK